MADAVEAPRDVVSRWRLAAGAAGPAGPGQRGRQDGLDGGGGLHGHAHRFARRRDATTTRGESLNHKNRRARSPHKLALGRCRGGWSSKVHLAVDGKLRPLSLRLTGGQAGEAIPSSPPPWRASAYSGRGRGGRSAAPRSCWPTRPTARGPTGRICAARHPPGHPRTRRPARTPPSAQPQRRPSSQLRRRGLP